MKRITRNTAHFKTVAVTKRLDGIAWEYRLHGNTATQVGHHVYLLGASTHLEETDENKPELIQFDLKTFLHSCSSMNIQLPRLYSHYAFLVDDSLVVISSDDRINVDIYKIDLLVASCNRLETLSKPPFRLEDIICALVEQSSQVVFFGGVFQGSQRAGKVFALGLESLSWSILNPRGTGPSPRDGHASCSISRSNETIIFVYGGRHNGEFYNDLHALHCATGRYQWSRVQLESRLPPLAYSGMTYLSGMIFVYGGFDCFLQDASRLVRYNTDDGTCETFGISRNDLHGNSFHELVSVESMGSILSFGGLGNAFDDVLLLKPL